LSLHLGWCGYSPIYVSLIAGMTGMYYHTQLLFIEVGSRELFSHDPPE
jgi:hypothetical protein